jgi:hypothetical protein
LGSLSFMNPTKHPRTGRVPPSIRSRYPIEKRIAGCRGHCR